MQAYVYVYILYTLILFMMVTTGQNVTVTNRLENRLRTCQRRGTAAGDLIELITS